MTLNSYSDIHLKASRGDELDEEDQKQILQPDHKGNTPLHWACFHTKISTANDLLRRGAHPNVQNLAGETCLFIAVRTGHADLVRVLLSWGADPNIPDNELLATPAHVAAGDGRLDILTLLANANAHLDAEDCSNDTPLHWAVRQAGQERQSVIEFLASRAAIDVQNDDSETPMDLAISLQDDWAETILTRSAEQRLMSRIMVRD